MTIKLPKIIQQYVDASNEHDVKSILSCFSDEALVRDEREEHRGKKSIEGWLVKTIEKYKFQFKPLSVKDDDMAIVAEMAREPVAQGGAAADSATLGGTIDYMAPELIRGQPATPASDIYALGCTVYEAAAGKTPFAHQSGFQKGIAHLDEEPPDPGAARADWSPALTDALLATLAKEPSDRPASAGAFASALRSAATQS